jgi:hypothetical protein
MRVFYCSTLFGAMTVAAAIDEGCFGPPAERRVLLVSSNGPAPEAHPRLDEQPGFAALRDRFDEIVSWNDLIAPLHPADWTPRAGEIPMLSRLVAERLGGVPTGLVLESIAVAPARAIASLVRDCPITVYSDGLMSYGPTRDAVPADIAGRITGLLHLDLVPGLQPLLLREHGVPATALPLTAFGRVVDSIPASGPRVPSADANAGRGTAMILGQYLSDLGIVTPAEEARLHDDLLRAVVRRGHEHVVFKPHPAAGRRHTRALRRTAEDLGVALSIAPDADPAEVAFREFRPGLVVGCFSTALTTAARLAGIPVATMGADLVLDRLVPYENSNRIPATLIDATVPRLQPDGTITDPPGVDVAHLVDAVGYCMQARLNPDLRPAAVDYLAAHGTGRYFLRRRLATLDLVPAPLSMRARREAAVWIGSRARTRYRQDARRFALALVDRRRPADSP